MSTADTVKTDQCSICLDSPPYSECPGRQCQRLTAALKAKEEAQRRIVYKCCPKHELTAWSVKATIAIPALEVCPICNPPAAIDAGGCHDVD